MRGTRRAAICWVLIWAMILSPPLVYSQEAAGGTKPVAPAGAKPTLGYVTPEATVAAVAHPRRVLTAPGMEMLPIEVISAAGQKELGFDPLQIEQVLAMAEAPQLGMPPQAGLVLRFAAPIRQERILSGLLERTAEDKLDGKTYRRGQGPMDFSIFQPDDRTLIVAHDGLLRRMLANRASPKEGAVSRLLDAVKDSPDFVAVLSVEPLRELASALLSQAPVPPPFAGVEKIPELLSSLEAKASFTGDMAMSLTARARDEAAAKELEQMIDRWLGMAKQAMLAEVAKQARSEDPVERAMAQYMQRMSGQMLETFRPKRDKDRLVLAASGQGQAQMATIGILVALLLPAVQAAREAARRSQSANNLKQIGLAMLNYDATHKVLPARANFDKEGKPLLSWRVHILPYLEQENLYKEFHLDEPWDSDHNRQLIPQMPRVYQNPSALPAPGKAHYLAVCGKGLMFEGQKGRSLADIRDGTSNTIMVVEANGDRAVIWTKPDDWELNADQPLAGLGSAHPGGFQVVFADGSVRFIAKTIDHGVFRALLTIAGGEPVGGF